MRNLLEQAVIEHLNGNAERAEELLHQFMVGRSRQIHESIRNGEEFDAAEEEVTEEYLDEADLSELTAEDGENLEGEGEESFEAEVDADLGDDVGGDFGGEDDFAADDQDDIEERLEDLLAKVEELAAEFEAAQTEEGDVSFDLDDETADETEVESVETLEDDMQGDDELEEDFDDLAESVVSELKSIKVDNADGKDAIGKPVPQNRKSPTEVKGEAKFSLKKTETHTGFDLEKAPSSKDLKKGTNTLKTAKLSNVAAPTNKEGVEQPGGKPSTSVNTKSVLNVKKK